MTSRVFTATLVLSLMIVGCGAPSDSTSASSLVPKDSMLTVMTYDVTIALENGNRKVGEMVESFGPQDLDDGSKGFRKHLTMDLLMPMDGELILSSIEAEIITDSDKRMVTTEFLNRIAEDMSVVMARAESPTSIVSETWVQQVEAEGSLPEPMRPDDDEAVTTRTFEVDNSITSELCIDEAIPTLADGESVTCSYYESTANDIVVSTVTRQKSIDMLAMDVMWDAIQIKLEITNPAGDVLVPETTMITDQKGVMLGGQYPDGRVITATGRVELAVQD